MKVRFNCQCGEWFLVYAVPGALHRCWKCRKRAWILVEERRLYARQDFTAQLVSSAPGYCGHTVL